MHAAFQSRIISDIRKGFDMVQSGKANQMYDKTGEYSKSDEKVPFGRLKIL